MRATRSASKADTAPSPASAKKIKTEPVASPSKPSRKRKTSDADIKIEPTTPAKRANTKKSAPKTSPTKKSTNSTKVESSDEQASSSPTKAASRAKQANPYGLSPGQSPYPSYIHPTPEECQDIHDRLSAIHGIVTAPKTIPIPSLNTSGCGEVPSVLDALIRTRLSAATNNENSSRAFRGLVDKFGLLKEGIGKGSVDWNKVRLAPQRDVFEAIKSGGLAEVKSRDILKILQLVYDENQARKAELAHDQLPADTSSAAAPVDAEGEVSKAAEDVISLDHLHSMDSDTAFNKLIQYPGVGPKTASCVLLFCMQRPSFAVDTHVFRLTSWLGWTPSAAEVKRMAKEQKVGIGSATTAPAKGAVKKEEDVDASDVKIEDEATPSRTKSKSKASPAKKPPPKPRGPPPVTRNSTYAHLDVRIPDSLKYPLHYLFIKHGKFCPECSAKKDAKIRAQWGNKKCPIRDVKVGKGKSKSQSQSKKVGGKGKGNEDVESDEEEGEDDLTEEDDEMEEAGGVESEEGDGAESEEEVEKQKEKEKSTMHGNEV